MYNVATGEYSECRTNFCVASVDDIGALLLDEDFLTEYEYYFEEGITGFKVSEEDRYGRITLTIQYWDGYDYEETTFYLMKMKVIGL